MRIANAVFFFVSGFGYTTWTSRIVYIQQSMHLDEAFLGWALLALPAGLMITMPLTGRLLSTYSSNRIMLAGTIAFNLMLALVGISNRYWEFICILFFLGSARNIMNLSINTQSVAVQALYRKSIMTTFHGIWSFAGFSGSVFSLAMAYFGVPPAWHLFVVSMAMSVAAMIAWPGTLYQPPERHKHKPIFRIPDRGLIHYAIICFATMACENVMYDWSGVYLHTAVHASKVMATAGFVVFMIFVTAGRFIGDRIVNTRGVEPVFKNSGLLIVGGFALAIALPYPLTAIGGFALIGLGVSCMVPLVYAMSGKSKTMQGGAAIAAVSTIGYLGFLFVPPIVGFVAQAASLRWAFGLIATLGLLIVWMTVRMRPGE